MASDLEPTVGEVEKLFEKVEAHFPSQSLGAQRWYLLTIAALTGGGQPDLAGHLYTYLINKPENSLITSRQALVRRLREALVKCVSIIGVVKPLEAVFTISSVERDEDKDYSFSRQDWKSGEANQKRGTAWLDQIYKHNRTGTINSLAGHKDFAWISTEITYGLYLSDHSILDPIDTEIVVLSGIMIQNMPKETGWHLRGIRRVGVSLEDVEQIYQCIQLVAEFAHVSLHKVPRPADIEAEV